MNLFYILLLTFGDSAGPPAPPSCQALFVNHFPCFLNGNSFCRSFVSDKRESSYLSINYGN